MDFQHFVVIHQNFLDEAKNVLHDHYKHNILKQPIPNLCEIKTDLDAKKLHDEIRGILNREKIETFFTVINESDYFGSSTSGFSATL
ncbi:hypothetical protein [Micavibrio aeruginosavorus]|uniref:hypothetical protein n=1 Tax=Micavibrio aeruginosavorus TaxID=349221 RepID=UPI003F4AD037